MAEKEVTEVGVSWDYGDEQDGRGEEEVRHLFHRPVVEETVVPGRQLRNS